MIDHTAILTTIFWTCLALVVYAYLVYPSVIWVLARWLGRALPFPPHPAKELPTVSLLIAAHNEEAVIAERLRNALAMDYPPDKREIVVASDGSTDATAAIVCCFKDPAIHLLNYPENRGKAATLNASFPSLTGQIVILSDANTNIDPEATRRLVQWFQLLQVGVVCGRLVLTDAPTGKNVDGLYWKYETFLKRCEGRLGALLGSNGAIYAMRKELFTPIPNDTIVDDFVIPLQAKLRTGCAIVYDGEAVAREETAPNVRSEFRRRARIGAGGFQAMFRLWRLLNPSRGWVAFTFLSHKILRWLCPFFLLGMVASNLVLFDYGFYRWLLLGQLTFFLLSVLGAWIPGRGRLLKPIRLLTMFTTMNLAILVGFWRWLSASQKGAWQRTTRGASKPSQGVA